MQHASNAMGKAAIGGSGAIAAVTTPSDYVSVFDRVYDLGWFRISGDDISQLVGITVSVLVSINIVYTICKDQKQRKG